jgi:acetyl esterase/lipase
MTQRTIYFALPALILGFGWILWAAVSAQSPKSAIRHVNDVCFATPAGETLMADLAIPTGPGPFPAVVCIHGGGWTSGSRKQMSKTLETLARRGYVAIAPDYRLAPKHPFPACLEDCKVAVRWLRGNATTYHVDPQRIAALGLSAGGHLACLLGVTDAGDGLEGNGGYSQHSSEVNAVVSFAGPTDLQAETQWSEEVLKKNLTPLLGGTPKDKADLARKASPISWSPRKAPPMLLVHGSDDRIVPLSQPTSFVEKMRKGGSSATTLVLEAEGHTWSGVSLLKSIDRMLTFLDETMQK